MVKPTEAIRPEAEHMKSFIGGIMVKQQYITGDVTGRVSSNGRREGAAE